MSFFKDKDRLINDLEARIANKNNSRPQSNAPAAFSFSPGFDTNFRASAQNASRSLMAELSDHETPSNKSFSNNSMCLENTEIDYLRQIVYSYMMGTDPLVI